MRSRSEHLQWCKDRALEYWRAGNIQDAVASMVSDLNKHPETKTANQSMMALGIIYVMQNDHDGVQRWIEGFR